MRCLTLLLLLLTVHVSMAQDAANELLKEDASSSSNAEASAEPKTESNSSEATADEAAAADSETNGDDLPVDEEATEESADSNVGTMLNNLVNAGALGLMLRGGVFMWAILLMAVIALGVIIERHRSLSMLGTDTSALRRSVQELLQADRVEDALMLCDREEGPIPAVLATGLRKYLILRRLNHDPADIQTQVNKTMDDYSVHIVAALERHLPVLGTISSVAPMLGFLGTVAGMITSFEDIKANMGEMNIVEAAASGISVALLTTCFGLIVGIPAYMAFNYFTSVINRNVLEVEQSATELIDTVTIQIALNRS